MASHVYKTPTSQEILTNVEAIDISRRLRTALGRGVFFAQALYQQATPVDIEMLETLIGVAHHLRYNPEPSEEEVRIEKYLHDSERYEN